RRRVDVLLLELAVRLEQNQLNFERQVVLQVGADLLVRAFRVARDAREVLFHLRVVIDLEVVGRVDVPLERVVMDLVLPEVGDERRLCGRYRGVGDDDEGGQQSQHGRREGRRVDARAHKQYLGLEEQSRSQFDITVTGSHLQTLCSENPL